MPTAAKTHAEFLARFWSKVNRDGPIPQHRPELGQCWEWTGARTVGYGSLRHLGRTRYAHIVSYEEAFGPLATGICVCHHCDNRCCVRPDHFFAGTKGDNLRDAASKGRMQRGEARPTSRLTEQQVREIRQRYANGGVSQTALAADYGVGQMTISQITRRATWQHID